MRQKVEKASGSQQLPSFPLSFTSMRWKNGISNGKQCIRLNLLGSKDSNGDITDPPSLRERGKRPPHSQPRPRKEWRSGELVGTQSRCIQSPLTASAYLSQPFSSRKQSLAHSAPYLISESSCPHKPQGENLPNKAMTGQTKIHEGADPFQF